MNKRTLTSWLLSCALLIGVIGSGLAQKGTGSSPLTTLRDGLIGYWDFDESSGNRAAAFQAGSLTWTDNNTVGSAAGKIGNAASLVKANSEDLSIADNAFVSMGTGSNDKFAITAWMYFNSDVSGSLFHALIGKNSGGAGDFEFDIVAADVGSGDVMFIESQNATTGYKGIGQAFPGGFSQATWYFIYGYADGTNLGIFDQQPSCDHDRVFRSIERWNDRPASRFYLCIPALC